MRTLLVKRTQYNILHPNIPKWTLFKSCIIKMIRLSDMDHKSKFSLRRVCIVYMWLAKLMREQDDLNFIPHRTNITRMSGLKTGTICNRYNMILNYHCRIKNWTTIWTYFGNLKYVCASPFKTSTKNYSIKIKFTSFN